MRFLKAFAALFVIAFVALVLVLQTVAVSPPQTNVDLTKPGPGRAERVDGVWFVWLSGPPEVRGADMYRLTGDTMRRIDATMHETFAQVIPSWPLRKVIEVVGRIAGRHLGEDIPMEAQREIVGQMHAYDDPFGDGGGKFNRFLSYLALHDLAQTIEHSPLIACSGFAVKNPSGTLVGRNFDFEAGRIFDEEKAITVFTPEQGHRFASIAWPGMNGVVTGINEKRVWISVNAARSDHEAPRGVPVSLAIRRVLEQADDAEHAVRLLKEMHARVADLYLVADPRASFVVEKTPVAAVVRGGDNVIVTNHFLDPTLRAEKRNQTLEQKTTSVVRFDRLQQLVKGPMDVNAGVAVLRDRTAPSGETFPVGDRRALDGYIATHGVLADFGRDAVWVSRAPHLSAAWLGVRLDALFEGRVERVEGLPEDPVSLREGAALGYRAPGQ